MTFLQQFYGGADQAIGLAAACLVWLGLAAIGLTLTRARGLTAGAPLYGWGLVIALYTVLGVFTDISFAMIGWGLGTAAALCGFYLLRRHGLEVLRRPVMAFVLALPLLLLVAAMSASQWDEFSHWLPSARFLLFADRFPNAAMPETGASFPAYPYGWPLLMFLGDLVAGGTARENIGPLFNVFMLLTFGVVLVDLIGDAAGREIARKKSWALIATGILIVTAFNPAFVQKLILTSYSETSTMVGLGLATVLAWLLLDRLAEGDDGTDIRLLLWQLALTLVVLVATRASNLVLFVGLLFAVFVVGVRAPTISFARLARLISLAAAPAVLVYAVWRFYVATEIGSREITVRAFDAWNIDLLLDILARMASVAFHKGAYFAMMVVVLGFGVKALIRCRTPLDRLAILASGIFVTYNLFLLFTYVAVFGENDALRAASYWRYNTHASFAGLTFAVVGISAIWFSRTPGVRVRTFLSRLAVVLLVALPFALSHKIRFDREPPKPYLRAVAAAIAPKIGPEDGYLVVDPLGSGESNVITRYHFWPNGKFAGYVSAFTNDRNHVVERILDHQKPKFVVLYSTTAAVSKLLGIKADPDTTYLLERSDAAWKIVGRWPRADFKG